MMFTSAEDGVEHDKVFQFWQRTFLPTWNNPSEVFQHVFQNLKTDDRFVYHKPVFFFRKSLEIPCDVNQWHGSFV